MVLTQAILSAVFGEAIEKFILPKLDELKPKDIQTVKIKEVPDGFSITILDDVDTTSQKWKGKDNADLEFENELAKESILKEISIIPNSNFKTLGKVMITVDDSLVFRNKSFTAFEDVVESVIKINKTIRQDSKVKVFIISSDGSSVGIAVQVTFGE